MQALLDPALALIVLAAGAALLLLGLRGVRLDRDPRCRARRCRYPLRELLDARRSASEPEWPITCPECGRVMESESCAHLGARRKIRPLVALGVALALPPVGVLGFEGYSQWQRASAVSTMPMWLLLRQAERDSAANNWVHQQELLDRVRAGSVAGPGADRVATRILRWQQDETVDMRLPGDAFAELHARALVTDEQLQRFWAHTLMYDLVLPDRIEAGGVAAFALRARYRAGESGAGLPLGLYGMFGAHDILYRSILTLERVEIDGEEIDIEGGDIRLVVDGHLSRGADHAHFVLHPQDHRWARIRAPDGAGDAVTIEVTVGWRANAPGEARTIQVTRAREPRDMSLTRLLSDLGVPTRRSLSFRGKIPVAED